MPPIILIVGIVLLIAVYYLMTQMQKKNGELVVPKNELPAVSEDKNLPALSEDINLPMVQEKTKIEVAGDDLPTIQG